MLWLAGVASAASVVDAVGGDFGDVSIALPFGQLGRFSPFYPAVDVNAAHDWVAGRWLGLAQEARVEAFRHGLVGTSLIVGSDLVARWTAPVGPTVQLGLGLGLSDTWRDRPVLKWDDAEGTYVPRHDPGRLGVVGGFTVAAGFDLRRATNLPLTPLLRYRWFVQAPFLPALPGPQGMLELGARWALGGGG